MITDSQLLHGLKWITNSKGCWLIIGLLPNHDGYIRIRLEGRLYYLHRLAYCLVNKLDYDDKSFQVNHRPECHNPACWNPNHLYHGSHQDNMSDRSRLVTHCPKGHEYNETNLKHYKGCRLCLKESNRRVKEKYQSTHPMKRVRN